jgi:FtsZ-interacting cell division protein YlmF
MDKDNWPLVVAVWAPSLVLLLAVILAACFYQRENYARRWKGRLSASRFPKVVADASGGLAEALDNATALNPYRVAESNDPAVHLGSAVRFAPERYQDAAGEISHCLGEGNVVSIDLSRMSHIDAARLVDFCSGMTIATSGWIFRITDVVIVVTPSSRR